MALPDYPTHLLGWKTGIIPDLLQAIGELAVVTAQIEETLHRIYWKHAGLNENSGPIVTDNLNPKRLSEDILKFARLDPAKANILADLEPLLAEFEALNTNRNQCLHWIWEKVESEDLPPTAILPGMSGKQPPTFQVKRPAYKVKGAKGAKGIISPQAYSAQDIQGLCNSCHWIERRLNAHALEESELRRFRQEIGGMGTVINATGNPVTTLADIFLPAPWLDKPLPPVKKPSNPPDGQK